MADRSKQICLDEKLAETVRNFKILYDKSSKDFKDKQKKALAWEEVAKTVGFRTGKDAENSFKNLRNRYSRDKKKIKAAKVSGTDTDSVTEVKNESSEMYSFLSWLDQYVQPRSSASNLVEIDDSAETDDISDETIGDNSDTDVKSRVTGRVQNAKRARSLLKENPVDKAEIEIIKKIGERLEQKGKSEVDEDSLFGQLIVSQLKKIPSEERIVTKMEINNVIYSHLLKSNATNQPNQNHSFASGSITSSSVNQAFPGMAG